MFDAILKNPALMQGLLGAVMKMIPADAWQAIVGELQKIAAYAKSADEKLTALTELQQRVDFLEATLRNHLPDAGVAFAEQQFWSEEAIEAALAPAKGSEGNA